MSNNHILTRQIGNLRGFSTDSIFLRPPNVADIALNVQRAPDGTLQLRRGYQCQIGEIGGLGMGTFDDPFIENVETVTISTDGFLYKKLGKQIYLHYNGQVTGDISNITNPSADLVQITSAGHGLQTGTEVIIRNVGGATELNNPATFNSIVYSFYTITVVDANNFIVNGALFSDLSPYTSGGIWSIYFADSRYLTLSIFTDPRFLNSSVNQSITCRIIANREAQINGNQNNVTTLIVKFGHRFVPSNTISFIDKNGVLQERTVLAATDTTVSISGTAVSVNDGVYLNQVIEFIFGKGFDVVAPYTIQDFINTATSISNGVDGLTIAVNGDTNLPAAFIQILETTIIPTGTIYTLNYWYWQVCNSPGIFPPFPGSANIEFQNSQNFENASFAAYDNVIYIANGWDFPQKYDGQTVYRAGMPKGNRITSITDNNTPTSKPFTNTGDVYQYAIAYEQVDNRGHILEGEISAITNYTVGATVPTASDLTINNLSATQIANWNTNYALATGSPAITVYGPDIDGFYYDTVPVDPGYTLKIGDSAYYANNIAAEISAIGTGFVIPVNAGHAIVPGDTVYFYDTTPLLKQRVVTETTSTSITVQGEPISYTTVTPNILSYKVSKVFGSVAIVDGDQEPATNLILVKIGHTVQLGDIVEFIDSQNNLQRREVIFVDATHVQVDGIQIQVSDLSLIYTINQRTDAITLQTRHTSAVDIQAAQPISNNLRINVYRTKANEQFGVNGELYLVASIPNDGSGAATQIFTDQIPDGELGTQFDDPDVLPNPPPISKYLRAFGTQMFYAGGQRGNSENSNRVFFSGVSGLTPNPEVVPLATNLFNVPNVDDDITGIGVSGSTLITTKNHSLWAATGNFLSGQIEVVQIAPGTNIGCVAHATIASVGTLMYFLHSNGVYAITENQLFPTDAFGNPIPITLAIDEIFRQTNFLPWTKYVLKRAVAVNYTKDNQYLLFLPCEDTQSTIRTANSNSIMLCYDYQQKNWFKWDNINAAGGIVIIDDDLYFQERRYSAVDGNTANIYKQHRFYRLVDHADHAGPQRCEWRSSWEDLGQPEMRKKFCRCILLMDRLSELQQYNNPVMTFSTYLDRISNLPNTIANVTQVDNIRNSPWSISPWGWGYWSGYQDSFVSVNLRQGTVAKSLQVGIRIEGINMDIRLAGFQLEVIPENRKTIVR